VTDEVSGPDPAPDGGDEGLSAVTARLAELAEELEGDPDEEQAARLVREASELAARAGEEVDRALRAAAEAREA
jgi:hypothetical protein